jgi:pSer/pThr/pTyr-binding forkhead associated (FHA) protein
MPAKLTLYPPRRASRFVVIRDGETLVIGRETQCGLVLEDTRVSKRHACLRWTGKGWVLEDLGSKNGTTVNGRPPTGAELADRDWIHFGGLSALFERVTAAQASALDSHRIARIQTSADLRRRLRADLAPADLLLRLLQSAMELTGTERGFVLVTAPDGKLRVEVADGFTPDEVRNERFRGSVGAVKQALEIGGPVVVADVPSDPRLGTRPSVVLKGIGSLACLPLRREDRILGMIYVDSLKLGPAFNSVDIEILETLATRAAEVLAGAREYENPRVRRPQEVIEHLQRRIEELLPAV